jgi:RecJ-like exonuclease
MTTINVYDCDEEVALPAKFEVCPRCEGTGSHVNPAIDGNGLTRDDFDEDPDFAEAYFAGDYDVRCEECKGRRVVTVFDPARATPEQRALWERHERAEAEARAEERSERRLLGYY